MAISYKDQLYSCNKCGFCLADCPVYKQTSDETYSARGLLTLAEAAQNGRLESSSVLKNRLSSCIRCLACADNCPSGLTAYSLIQQTKEKIVNEDGLDVSKKLFCRSIAKNQWLMGKALKWGKILGQFEGSVPDTARKNFYRLLPEVIKVKNPKANVGFFVGCAINLWYPQIGLSAVKLLAEAGYQVTIPKRQKCCSVPVMTLGDVGAAQNLVSDNLKAFKAVDVVVTACASCGLMLKNESARLGAPAVFRRKVKDITEFLVDNDIKVKARAVAKSVTYHDPCHLNRGQNISTEPRQLLESIPKLKLVETENAEACCGGGGTFRLYNQDLAVRIANEKIEAVKDSGASILATSCPGCIMQFDDIYLQEGRGLPVKHVVELLAGE